MDGGITNMRSVGVVALLYKAERAIGNWSDEEVRTYEMGVARMLE